ncbi:cytochrome ubiquinol oxidase subunit I [Rummeliibacillus sp. POC4]|uniref:cytochrome ubiquinol oxidase subunit I n=1 Tax=Rummeliibacillus sp. POC4 TaxID=2305899 RepID=UPI000E66E6F2|nr:cytochrome ubiquinol oxidase subunit I [Rummeliibacillus sp. POC4]RIJ63026.1 cytochrome ubiquinol oxidase subunit I [Rummeliibacillus sp. POC4]
MDVLILARIQYAITTIFHFFFVPFSISMIFLVSIFETMYVWKKKKIYLDMSLYWGKIFLISFAIGVVTGILQEFQFGMNWSEYSRFMGDVFGAPLAVEALLAFFMESTFIGVWMFGRNKLPKWVIALSAWLVTFGTTLSALWILAANSFMQEPVGFKIENGKAVLTDFMALLTNPQLLVEFPHTIFGALATGTFVVAGICAYNLLKKRNTEFFKKTFNYAMVIACIAGIGIALSGHTQAQHLMSSQPMKMAASEALWEDSGDPAAWTIVGGIDTENKENKWEVNIPYLLSYLAYSEFDGSVEGMKTLQAKYEKLYGENINYIPPVKTVFWSFRIMAGFGGLMIVISLLGLWFANRKTLEDKKWFLQVLLVSIALPFIANTAGWIMTEIGRQPWTVFGYYTTAQSISPNVSKGQILFSTISFSTLYVILAIVLIILVARIAKQGPDMIINKKSDSKVDLMDKEAFEE